jgi:hypothetical protein
MKNSLITLSVSALVAAALLPVSIGLIASVTAVTGMLALALGDVVRDIKPLTLSAIPATGRRARLPYAA